MLIKSIQRRLSRLLWCVRHYAQMNVNCTWCWRWLICLLKQRWSHAFSHTFARPRISAQLCVWCHHTQRKVDWTPDPCCCSWLIRFDPGRVCHVDRVTHVVVLHIIWRRCISDLFGLGRVLDMVYYTVYDTIERTLGLSRPLCLILWKVRWPDPVLTEKHCCEGWVNVSMHGTVGTPFQEPIQELSW